MRLHRVRIRRKQLTRILHEIWCDGLGIAKVPVLQGIIGLLYGSTFQREGTSQVKNIAARYRG